MFDHSRLMRRLFILLAPHVCKPAHAMSRTSLSSASFLPSPGDDALLTTPAQLCYWKRTLAYTDAAQPATLGIRQSVTLVSAFQSQHGPTMNWPVRGAYLSSFGGAFCIEKYGISCSCYLSKCTPCKDFLQKQEWESSKVVPLPRKSKLQCHQILCANVTKYCTYHERSKNCSFSDSFFLVVMIFKSP